MKILIIRCWDNYMDVKNASYNIQELGLAKALTRRGHQCDIIFFTPGKEETVKISVDEKKEICVFYKTGRVFLHNPLYYGLKKMLREYDIVQTAEYNSLLSMYLAWVCPKKVVIYHGPYFCGFNYRYNLFCRIVDPIGIPIYRKKQTEFLVKSRFAATFLEKKGISKTQISVAAVGIDMQALETGNNTVAPREVQMIDQLPSKCRLLYVGKLETRRNIPFLLDLLMLLRKKIPDAVLVIVGSGDKQYVDECMQLAKEKDVYEAVYRIEKLEQKYLPEVYKKCDVFLLPTYYEIFGMVLLEAMAYGIPVLTTENGGSDMLIHHGEDGYILPLIKEEWVDTICNLQEADKKAAIGKAAEKKVMSHFTWDSVAVKFESIYLKKQGDKGR